jgi:pimeloyl-ACP methyl ester carboxylesterase
MTKHYCFPIFLLALATLAQAAPAAAQQDQQVPEVVMHDPVADTAHPARMEVPDILSHGKRLYAIFYIASGEFPHPTVLLMHGFPGNEQNLDLAQAMRRAGWNVLFPHYRGSWGSEGSFSFSNSIEDTQAALQFLRDPANVKKYGIDVKRIVLIGHSMGGFMVAYAGSHDPGVLAVGMISAWNIGKTLKNPVEGPALKEFQADASRLAGTTAGQLITEGKWNAAKWNFVDYAPALKARPVLIIESDDGLQPADHEFAEALRNAGNASVSEQHIAADHTYSDHRIALEAAVVSWLQQMQSETKIRN